VPQRLREVRTRVGQASRQRKTTLMFVLQRARLGKRSGEATRTGEATKQLPERFQTPPMLGRQVASLGRKTGEATRVGAATRLQKTAATPHKRTSLGGKVGKTTPVRKRRRPREQRRGRRRGGLPRTRRRRQETTPRGTQQRRFRGERAGRRRDSSASFTLRSVPPLISASNVSISPSTPPSWAPFISNDDFADATEDIIIEAPVCEVTDEVLCSPLLDRVYNTTNADGPANKVLQPIFSAKNQFCKVPVRNDFCCLEEAGWTLLLRTRPATIGRQHLVASLPLHSALEH